RDDGRIMSLLANIINNDEENQDLRIAAARALGEFGNSKAVHILTPVARSHAPDGLGFWAAISLVKLLGSAPPDKEIVATIRNYDGARFKESGDELRARHEALQKVAQSTAFETTPGWLTVLWLAIVGAGSVGAIWLTAQLWRHAVQK